MEIKLSETRKKEIIGEVQGYFSSEYDERIGELKAELLVDFFIASLGAKIYNQAIDDAHTFIQERLIDLDGILYIPE